MKIREFEIDLTGTCNLQCDRCSRNYVHAQHLKVANIRPLNEIVTQLDTYPDLEKCTLAGQVSEPTLYPDFRGFLKYLKSRRVIVDLYTNASKLDLELFADIGNILSDQDKVIFTICGSRQSLHEYYRKGSDLQTILDNAAALRQVRPIDVCQYIRFRHNYEDWKSGNWTFLGFTRYFWCESEGERLHNDTIKERKTVPVKQAFYEILFNKLSKKRFNKNEEFVCSHLNDGKIYIDQFGKVFPCYSIAEYDKILLENFDYNFYHKDACRLCSKYSRDLMQKFGLDFIC